MLVCELRNEIWRYLKECCMVEMWGAQAKCKMGLHDNGLFPKGFLVYWICDMAYQVKSHLLCLDTHTR